MKKSIFINLLALLLLLPFIGIAQTAGVFPFEQINNGGFEDYEGSGATFEPKNWNSFGTAYGSQVSYVNKTQALDRSANKRPGSTGNYSVKIYSRTIYLGIIPVAKAQGNLTTGCIKAGSMTPTSQDNHNETQINKEGFYHSFSSLPDRFSVWVKFIPNNTSYEGRVSAVLHGNTNFEEPSPGAANDAYKIGGALKNITYKNKQWEQLYFDFEYEDKNWDTDKFNNRYILISIATNKDPGKGSEKDTLYIDDIELIYNKEIKTNDPSSRIYATNDNITVPCTITGAMFPNTTLVAQLSDRNGSFANPTPIGTGSTGSNIVNTGTIQVTGTIPAGIPAGSGYRVRVISTDNYIVTGTANPSNITIRYTPPTDLAVIFNDDCKATLTWTAPQGAASSVTYNIYRDGEKLTPSPISTTTYTDNSGLASNKEYEWCVAAVGNGVESEKACKKGTCVTYTILASASVGGTISPAGDVVVREGKNKEFIFTANTGYELTSVMVDGINNAAAVATGKYTFTDVRAAGHTIRAEFEKKQYTIAVTSIGNGSTNYRSVSVRQGEASVTVEYGANEAFTFEPDTDSELTEVSIDGTPNAEAVSAKSYTFKNVTENQTIAVKFKKKEYPILVSVSGSGKIKVDEEIVESGGEVMVEHGSNKTFTFVPDDGASLSKVIVDDKGVTVTDSKYTFTGVIKDHTLRAEFTLKTYTIIASVIEGEGTISPSGSVYVNHGANQTFTFTPDNGSELDKLLVNGVPTASTTPTTYEFTKVASNQSIAVSFKKREYLITVNSTVGGTISPATNQTVKHGDSKTFTFEPDEGYELSQILVDGNNVADSVIDKSYTFKNVTKGHSIGAKFTKIEYTITSSSSEGGAINPAGETSVEHGDNLSFTLTAETGYELKALRVDGTDKKQDVRDGTYTLNNIRSDHEIVAEFGLIEYTVTTQVSAGEGTVTPSASTVSHNGSVTFTIEPGAGYVLGKLLVNSNDVTGEVSDGVYVLNNITSDCTAVAEFVKIKHLISVSVGENGSMEPGTDVSVEHGNDQLFTITPDDGFAVNEVLIDGTNNPGAVSAERYTFSNVTKPHSISVTFGPAQYKITVKSVENGSITPSGVINAAHGDTKEFEVKADLGYLIEELLVDENPVVEAIGKDSYSLILSDIQGDYTISAKFKFDKHVITASAGIGGAIAPAGNSLIAPGEDIEYTITPETGYQIEEVLIDGTPDAEAVTTGSYTFTNVSANHTIAVAFKLQKFTITASVNNRDGGTISPSGEKEVAYGSSQAYTITVKEGYDLTQVLIDGENNAAAVIAKGYTFTDVTANHTIEAVFTPQTFTITATAGTGGTITPGTVTVNYNSNQAFTMTPSTGYDISAVKIDGKTDTEAAASGSYMFANVKSDHTIDVTFTKRIYTFTTSVVGEGTISSSSGSNSVEHGGSITFTITPISNAYRIEEVLVENEPNANAVETGKVTFDNVTKGYSIVAKFEIKQYAITPSVEGVGGTIDPDEAVMVTHGEAQTFTFTPDEGYKLVSVIVDTNPNDLNAVSKGSYTFSNVSAPHTIKAAFEKLRYDIIASVEGAGGKISPNGTQSVEWGASETFTFIPDEGYEVDKAWIDGIENTEAAVNKEYTFTNVTEKHTVAVSFKRLSYTITPEVAGEGGSITPADVQTVFYGESKLFTFVPATGYAIEKVLVDGEANAEAVENGTYTFANVTANHTISVSFKRLSYTITPEVTGEGGAITPSEVVTVLYGESQLFTIAPLEGYKIAEVLIDGENNPAAVASGSYTFENVTASHSIKASFERLKFVIASHAEGGDTGCTISPTGTTEVFYGESQVFLIQASADYEIINVLVDGQSVGIKESYTFENVTDNHAIVALFQKKVSIGMVDDNETVIYPNPSQGRVFIRNTGAPMRQLQVFDLSGRMLLNMDNINSHETSLDLSAFENGLYLIRIDGKTTKLLKN